MGKQSFLESVREFIGGIGWRVFLWSIRMTDEEYLDAVIRDNTQQGAQADETICHCAHDKYENPNKSGHCMACGKPFRN